MFKWVVLFSALFLATIAALFSVTGISHLFVGAMLPAAFMAVALELGKLTSVSFVYRHWKSTSKVLRSYMLAGAIALSLITSIGVYSYLSAAYSSSALSYEISQSHTEQLQSQQTSLQGTISQNNGRISQLQDARSHQETRLDSLVGKNGFVTQQRSVQNTESEIQRLQSDNRQLMRSKDSLSQISLQQDSTIKSTSKIATFAYFAKALGIKLDTFVTWFILLIVLVFDPMAVCLIVAYNIISQNESKDVEVAQLEAIPEIEEPLQIVENIEEKDPIEEKFNGPYFLDPEYNWNTDNRWRTDPSAIHYRQAGVKSVNT